MLLSAPYDGCEAVCGVWCGRTNGVQDNGGRGRDKEKGM